jgi:hypothetical protein
MRFLVSLQGKTILVVMLRNANKHFWRCCCDGIGLKDLQIHNLGYVIKK